MIALLSGTVADRRLDSVVINCSGVGYRLSISSQTLAAVPDQGGELSLFVHLVVRDDAIALYGFASEAEQELFLMLLGVPSVGPKVALAVLSSGDPGSVLSSIAAGDVGRLQSVPGIGKRTAERICLDLRDAAGAAAALLGATSDTSSTQGLRPMAREALLNLGLDERETERLLDEVDGDTVEELISNALKRSAA